MANCNKISNVRIKRAHIWGFAKHGYARQFQHWQAEKYGIEGSRHGATVQDDRQFGRILQMKPEEFIAQLKKRGLISEDT